MGCDIHFFAEVKIKGAWYLHSAPSIERWYAMFTKMAGVRGDVSEAIAAPKGLPSDLSVVVRQYWEYWEADGHSASWLSSSEIEQLEKWLKDQHAGSKEYFYPEKLWGYLFGSSWGGFHKYGADPATIEDVRFVFWFDN